MAALAVIDMGTNTFNALAVKPMQGIGDGDFPWQVLYQRSIAVRLGEEGMSHRLILPRAQARAIEALQILKEGIVESGVLQENIQAIGTSAVRSASNQAEFLSLIFDATGLKVKVIDGETEASLIAKGATWPLLPITKPSLVMDIGGGSVEYVALTPSIGINDKDLSIDRLWTLDIGVARLEEQFPCDHDEVFPPAVYQEMVAWIKQRLNELQAYFGNQPMTLLGCAGTFDTLHDMKLANPDIAKMDADINNDDNSLSIGQYSALSEQINSRNRDDRAELAGMSPLRVDMIVYALALIDATLSITSFSAIYTSHYALKEGALLDILQG